MADGNLRDFRHGSGEEGARTLSAPHAADLFPDEDDSPAPVAPPFLALSTLTPAAKSAPVAPPLAPRAAPEAVLPGLCLSALVDTAEGAVPAEELMPGDRIITRERGIQRLRWVGRCRLGRDRIAFRPDMAPVRIARGAFGPGLPARDLLLAPHHRIFLRDDRARAVVGSAEFLVAVRDLVGRAGITLARGPVETVQLVCDGHALIRADGLWMETLHPTPACIAALAVSDRAALREIGVVAHSAPVRPQLPGCAVRQLFAS